MRSDHGLPSSLVPPYPTGIDPHILLYRGEGRLLAPSGTMNGQGVLAVNWKHGPEISFDFSPTTTQGAIRDIVSTEVLVVLEEVHATCSILLTRSDGDALSEHPRALGGILNEATALGAGPVSMIDFSVLNFPPVVGEGIRDADGTERSGRLTLRHEEWILLLDSTRDSRDQFTRLQREGGHGLLHVGRLMRQDGEAFAPEAGERVLHGLFLFLSFVSGDWSPVFLPVGRDAHGDIVWRRWGSPLCRPWMGRLSWFSPLVTHHLSESFDSFMRLLFQLPSGTMQRFVCLYVEANGHVLMESRIVLAKAALELLAWLHSSSAKGQPSDDPRNLLDAATCGDLDLPESLSHLTRLAPKLGHRDGLRLIDDLRNALVHPASRKSKKVFSASPKARREGWILAMYYLDLGLLYWLGHSGSFLHRADLPRTVWSHRVGPWV